MVVVLTFLRPTLCGSHGPRWASEARPRNRRASSPAVAHPHIEDWHLLHKSQRLSTMLVGVPGLGMSRRTAQRLLAVLAVVAIVSFAFASAAHWHGNSTGDEQCQVCHLAHSVSLGLSSTVLLLAPVTVGRLAQAVSTDPKLELAFRHVSPRAPPAAVHSA